MFELDFKGLNTLVHDYLNTGVLGKRIEQEGKEFILNPQEECAGENVRHRVHRIFNPSLGNQ